MWFTQPAATQPAKAQPHHRTSLSFFPFSRVSTTVPLCDVAFVVTAFVASAASVVLAAATAAARRVRRGMAEVVTGPCRSAAGQQGAHAGCGRTGRLHRWVAGCGRSVTARQAVALMDSVLLLWSLLCWLRRGVCEYLSTRRTRCTHHDIDRPLSQGEQPYNPAIMDESAAEESDAAGLVKERLAG